MTGTGRRPGSRRQLLADVRRTVQDWPARDEADRAARADVLRFVAAHGAAALDRDLRVGHLTASVLLLDAARARVLLTLHPLAGRWFQLGGHLEPTDATVVAAAHREAVEESGIDALRIDPVPIGLDRHPTTCRDSTGTAGPSSHLDLKFLGIAAAGATARRSAESVDLAWFDIDGLPPGADAAVHALVARARSRYGRVPR